MSSTVTASKLRSLKRRRAVSAIERQVSCFLRSRSPSCSAMASVYSDYVYTECRMGTRTAMSQEQAFKPSVAVPFAAIVLAMLPAVLDQTILATALPTIATDLGRISDVSWVVTAYVVAAAALTPLWGKLGDRHGRKLLLEVALIMFVSASALCGAAQDITELIVLRAVQGAAAGGLMAPAHAVVGAPLSPPARRAHQGRH